MHNNLPPWQRRALARARDLQDLPPEARRNERDKLLGQVFSIVLALLLILAIMAV